MSEPIQSTAREGAKSEYFDYKHVGGRFVGGLVIAILFLGITFGWGYYNPDQFAHSWLFAFYFYFTICIGAVVWILIHYASDAEWSVVVRRQLENMGALLPIVGLLFIPLIFVAPTLWQWLQPVNAHDPLLLEKQGYLNPPFFWIRAVFYFVFLGGVALIFRAWSIAQDKSGAFKYTVYARRLTFGSLPFFAIAVTFSAVDWLMGLDYHWFSTMWGVYIFAGAALSGLCVLVLVITALRRAGYLQGIVTLEHYHIMGKLMLSFTVFWAYIAFSQYMLIWYANIPEETWWFIRRNTESWAYLNWALAIGHFFIPFVFLLQEPLKRKPKILCAIAVWLLAFHLLDIYIIILPEFYPAGVSVHPLDVTAVIAMGATLITAFLVILGKSPLYPQKDPRLELSIHLKN